MDKRQKLRIANDGDIENAKEELLLITNKYHLSLKQFDEVYEHVRETIEKINPVILLPSYMMEFVCEEEKE